MMDEFERMGKEAEIAYFKALSSLEGLMKATETISRYASRDLKWVSPKYKAEKLPPDPTCFVKELMKTFGHITAVQHRRYVSM
jgi:hypothetical protein